MLLCVVTGTGRRQIGQQTQDFVAVTASLVLKVSRDFDDVVFGHPSNLEHCGDY